MAKVVFKRPQNKSESLTETLGKIYLNPDLLKDGEVLFVEKENEEAILFRNDKNNVGIINNSGSGGTGAYLPLSGGTLFGNVIVEANIEAENFIKTDSSNEEILLGAGGTKSINDFVTSTILNNYFPISGGTVDTITSNTFVKTNSSDDFVLLGGGGEIALTAITATTATTSNIVLSIEEYDSLTSITENVCYFVVDKGIFYNNSLILKSAPIETIQAKWIDTGLASWTGTSSENTTDNAYHQVKFKVSATTCPSVDDGNILTAATGMFSGCTALTSVGEFDTKNCTTMNKMFSGCTSLQSVQLLNTSKITDMSNFFSVCTNLTNVPLFNTSSVTNMAAMFSNCKSLVTVPLFNTSKVTNMTQMFVNCDSLTGVPLLNTSAVTTMTQMFWGCTSLTGVSFQDASLVTATTSMFSNCTNLKTVELLNTPSLSTMATMFSGCTSLEELKLGDLKVGTLSGLCSACTSIKKFEIGNASALTTGITSIFPNLILNNSTIQEIKFGNLDKITNLSGLCSGYTSLQKFSIGNISSACTSLPRVFFNCYSLTDVSLFNCSRIIDTSYLFFNCKSLTIIPDFGFTSIRSCGYMFAGCENLVSIPDLDFNLVTSVTASTNVFAGCSALTECKISNLKLSIDFSDSPYLTEESITYMFDNSVSGSGKTMYLNSNIVLSQTTINKAIDKGWLIEPSGIGIIQNKWIDAGLANFLGVAEVQVKFVTGATYVPLVNDGHRLLSTASMFSACTKLTRTTLFDTSNVTNMSYMFSGCSNLTSIPEYITSAVTSMNNMFCFCSGLTSVPFFETSAVTNMSYMFSGCSNLTGVPNFNTSAVTDISRMFLNCNNLTGLPIFDTSNVTNISGIVSGCTNIKELKFNDFPKLTMLHYLWGSVDSGGTKCKKLEIGNLPLVTGASDGFLTGFNNLESLTIGDMPELKSLKYFFRLPKLTALTIGDTSKVTSTTQAFYGVTSLTSVPLFETSGVSEMSQMFWGCTSLTGVPLYNTSNVVVMDNLFSGCTSLVTVPELNFQNMYTGSNVFLGCSSLTNCHLINLKKSISFSNSPNLSRESILFMVNNSITGGIMTLHATARARLTTEDVDAIHAKSWSLNPMAEINETESETELQTVLPQKEKNKNLIRKLKDFFMN
ncbi:hypothetical protein EZS27_008299 [termite gut metagenome]|uniref:Uncharacterized protein n=1 Tax=termite gut metagenome TaxID=433724 RepID=A0A5J4SE85_9ZZZZ